MSNRVSFDRLEDYMTMPRVNGADSSDQSVLCSFETQRFGYAQFGYSKRKTETFPEELDDMSLETHVDEPNLAMFTKAEQRYIKKVLLIVHRLVFDGQKPKMFL